MSNSPERVILPPGDPSPGQSTEKKVVLSKKHGRILAIVFVIALSALILIFRDQVEKLGAYGYPGIFIFSLVTSATVILPAPGLVLVFSMGAVLHPALVALVAGTGASLGELSGYLAGLGGQGVIENTKIYNRIHGWMVENPRYSGWMIFGLAILPIPFFDLAGIAAGTLGMPVARFLGWTVTGKIIKMLMVAYLGNASIGSLL